MNRLLNVFVIFVLIMVGISATLGIRAHYMVWKYSPDRERLPRGPSQPQG